MTVVERAIAGKSPRASAIVPPSLRVRSLSMSHWVSDSSQLDDLAHAIDAAPVALDTEFIRERTYYPKLALVQMRSARGEEALVDPVALSEAGALRAVLEGPVLKLMHSPSEDLQALLRGWGVIATPLFDTQLAAALTGLGAGKSYQALVEQLLGVHLEKGETRSDWLQRPLTASQQHYAAEDVRHLHALHERLDHRLAELGRSDWLRQDCDRMVQTAREDGRDPQPHLSSRSAQRMDREAQMRLRRLLLWRDQVARSRDLPRGWVVDNELVVLLASRPLSRSRFDALLDQHPRAPRRSRDALWEALSRPPSEDEHDIPLVVAPDPALRAPLKAMQAVVAHHAADLDIPEGVLCAKRYLEYLLANRTWPEALDGWRADILKQELMARLP